MVFFPQESCSLLIILSPELASFSFYTKIKKEKKRKGRRFIGGESEEESENVRWCEEMEKFRGVFIWGDCNIGYIYHKYSQKT
jgi:hypothetical protein